MIKLENIQKVFRTEEVETVALGGVSLEVKKGEFVAIMGPSGCGKSTLLNILGLLDNPTSGTYLLDGENVGQLKESQRTKVRKGQIGFVFQSFNLIDELNVEENVELPLTYLGVPKKERKQRVDTGLVAPLSAGARTSMRTDGRFRLRVRKKKYQSNDASHCSGSIMLRGGSALVHFNVEC